MNTMKKPMMMAFLLLAGTGCLGDVHVDLTADAAPGTTTTADGGVVADSGMTTPVVDAGVTPQPTTRVEVAIEVPASEAVQGARICGTFSGIGWDCEDVALGGQSGRRLATTFTYIPDIHIFNVCLRQCDDAVRGRWMLHKSGGQAIVLATPAVTTVGGCAKVIGAPVDNGQQSYNWPVDMRVGC